MTTNNIVQINSAQQTSPTITEQEMIDDIGAKAFLYLRDSAEQLNIPIKKVIVEHLLGLTLVMKSVEGKAETQRVLARISEALNDQ